MSKYDWSRFVKRISIDADVKDIYDAWATRRGLESWFLSKAEFVSDGAIRASESRVQKAILIHGTGMAICRLRGTKTNERIRSQTAAL